MTLRELAETLPQARLIGADGETSTEPGPDVDRIVHRSDAAAPGAVFCALRGLLADGHDFAADAVARGAAAVVVERDLDLPVPRVLVPDSRLAMALMAALIEGRPSESLRVVGVTGTNGKTSSAFLMHAILTAAGERAGLIGTIETRVGGVVSTAAHTTPESSDLQRLLARMRDAGDTACAMEVSSHALAQRRVAGVTFAAALFTNLTRDHLDYHADLDEYWAAKRALFVRPPGEGPDPPCAANVDDPRGRELVAEAGALGYGTAAEAEVRPLWARLDGTGIAAEIRTPRGPLAIESRLRGRFNLFNLLGAVAVGELLGLEHGAVAAGIAALNGIPGRFEPVDAGQPFPVLVDYAHTPDSLENVLVAARELADGGRLIVVFGCGGDRDRGKRPQMGDAVRRLGDLGIVTSDNPRTEDPDEIIREVLAGATGGPAEILVEEDRARAIARAVGEARAGDVVVIAGKGHEQGQERMGVVRPFDDRTEARRALETTVAEGT